MRLFVLSGGNHPYEETTPVLVEFLQGAGHKVDWTKDAAALVSGSLNSYDALVFNTLRREETTLNVAEREAMTQFISGGKGFVCIHISGALPEAWPAYHDVTGGGWVFGTSTHPPYGTVDVQVTNDKHPCSEGISDFTTDDEHYTRLAWNPGNDVFMTAELDGTDHPMGWTRKYGEGKVMATALGHNGLSFENPNFQRLVLNGVDYVAE